MTQAQAKSSAPARPVNRGPLSILLSAVLGFVFATIMAWLLGITVGIVGLYFLWPEQGLLHTERQVEEGLAQLAAYPSCAVTGDTVRFAQTLAESVTHPFIAIGALHFIQVHSGPVPTGLPHIQHSLQLFLRELAKFVVIAIHVAQGMAIRFAIALFVLPLFALLCLLALVDGLVRRDLRKWSGGRESSFIYHHAKKWTGWVMTVGFALFLAWPFGGVNPIYMALTLCAFAAWSLTITTGSFKKYL